MKKFFTSLLLGCAFLLLHGGTVTLAQKGKPTAIIVLPDNANPVARYAAGELVWHVKRICGAELKTVPESKYDGKLFPIYLGATQAAEKAGFGQKNFAKEAWTIRSTPRALYLTGGENSLELMHFRTPVTTFQETASYWKSNGGFNRLARRGTLYSVTEFLQRICGVRWLWPGELGTLIPKRADFTIPDNLNISGAPRFTYRQWRIMSKTCMYFLPGITNTWSRKRIDPYTGQLYFSQHTLERYFDALRRFILLYQEGDSEPLPAPASHIFHWHREVGKQHPGFFAMNDHGKRVPERGLIRLCVSNPDLPQWVVNNKWDGGDWIGLGEADTRGFCRCKTCMEWDKPQDPGHVSYSTTNRYLRYYKKVWELAKKKNPNVKVSILMYMDYTHPPTGEHDLSWIFGKFVPWGSGYSSYYPMSKKDLEVIRRGWLGWGRTGAKIHYRPNYLLSGYTIPALDVEQSGEMFRFGAQNGMVGFDFDSLSGYWSTKGPTLYMHMRLSNDPDLTIETILKEYYSAFGPAADLIRKYFDHWIAVTKKLSGGGVGYGNANQAAELYTVAQFDESGRILDAAIKAAAKSKDKNHLERVKFIRLGWQHARMCVEFSHLFKENKFTEARAKLNEIIAFRRKYEDTFFCDLAAASSAESRGYKGLADFIRGKFRNFHAPRFQWKNFKRSECFEIKGFIPSTWSLALRKNVKSGHITYKYDAGKNNSFNDAKISVYARNLHVTNILEISFDNKTWTKIASDISKKTFDITKFVTGKPLFYLRFSSARRKDDKNVQMTLISFRLDFTKKNPEAVPVRAKPVLGSGWLEFNPKWFYRKDLKNQGLAKNEMNVKTFSPKNWIPVKVPAKLDATPVGPYLGHGWYSTVFDIRKDWDGRSLDILFMAIDKEGWVYFNGHYVGEHTVKSEKVGVGVLYNEPFIIKVPAKYINFGGKNLLQVKTHSSFGASGIWKEVKIRPVDASATY